MRFGGSQIPIRLRVARTILYCQAVIMVLIAILALEVLIIGGTSTGISLTGLVDKQALTGSGVTALALVLVVIGIVLVVVEQQVVARGASARPLLAVAEVALAVYLIGFVTNSVETWVFGPAAGAAVLLLHYWPELHAYFFASDSTAPATAIPVGPAPAAPPDAPTPPVSADPPVNADLPAGAAEPNSDVAARPTL
jgi:hypothetical protein